MLVGRSACAFCLVVVLAACDSAPASFGLAKRPQVYGFAFPISPATASPVQAARAFPLLDFEQPVVLAQAPDQTDRVFVVEAPGRIRVFSNSDSASSARRVAPGTKESSVLWERMRRRDCPRMPTLGSDIVDPLAIDVVGAWIDAGP